jgi:hypothetical protein
MGAASCIEIVMTYALCRCNMRHAVPCAPELPVDHKRPMLQRMKKAAMRSIHEHLQAKASGEPHEYCAL